MSFISSVIIKMIEKELAEQTPEIEQAILLFLGQVAKNLVEYVEQKIEIKKEDKKPEQLNG